MRDDRSLGAYLHVPFCGQRCAYCDFNTYAGLKSLIPAYVSALLAEFRALAPWYEGSAATLYLGGGTPSLLDAENVFALLNSVKQKFTVSNDLEITIEVNPGTITSDKLTGYLKAGVNRINIGIQSFQDSYLTSLGRIHNAREAFACFEIVRLAGFENIGVDLI